MNGLPWWAVAMIALGYVFAIGALAFTMAARCP
jgi:hypothetical protein